MSVIVQMLVSVRLPGAYNSFIDHRFSETVKREKNGKFARPSTVPLLRTSVAQSEKPIVLNRLQVSKQSVYSCHGRFEAVSNDKPVQIEN